MNRREFFARIAPGLRHADPKKMIPADQVPAAPLSFFRSSFGLEPYSRDSDGAWDYAKAAHLLRRTMIGPTEREIRDAVAAGPDATIRMLMIPFDPDLTLIADWAGTDPRTGAPEPAESPEFWEWFNGKLERRERLGRWWLRTMVKSSVSIQERMTFFWHCHFVSEVRAVEWAEFMYHQNQLLRRNALGNFRQFVKEITVDESMLIYLNGVDNFVDWSGSHINENYARELMELFTMGPADWNNAPNYTQRDVAEGARAFSGWGKSGSPVSVHHNGLGSTFDAGRWDSGAKKFLGRTGPFGAMDAIDVIFSERADQVAKFICEKIYRAFVHHVPDREIVAGMAATFREHDWEIRPVMEQLLRSRHFYDPTNIGAMERSVVDYHLSIIRSMGLARVMDFQPNEPEHRFNDLLNRLLKMGQMPFHPPNVKGWAEGRAWVSVSTLPGRQKFAIDVARGDITVWMDNQRGTWTLYELDPIALARTFPRPDDIRQLCDDMARHFLGNPPSPGESEMLYRTMLSGGTEYEWSLDDPDQRAGIRIRAFLAALVQLPKFQLY